MEKNKTENETPAYENLQEEFIAALRGALSELRGEISERNEDISERDSYIYGDMLEKSLDIPIGHDFTPVNWLRRTVEIHKIQFMGRPFQVISTYDTKDTSVAADDEEKQRLENENKKEQALAEERKRAIDDIIRDNGGHSLFMDGAESASAVGCFVIKSWYDPEEKRYNLVPIEAVENCYAVWNRDNFRSYDGFAFVHQISKATATSIYGCDDDVATSLTGEPLDYIGQIVTNPTSTTQPMVTVMEYTGILPGWKIEDGKIAKDDSDTPQEFNVFIIGNDVRRATSDEKSLPRYYILPNKRQRRRPWGASDISDAAIRINQTYVETLSDWRTVASKLNFPKFKAFNFSPDATMPKYANRKVQVLPMADGQDLTLLNQGDTNQIDFRAQLDECKEQFVRETGISRVLFDDPSVTLNSNQALLTSMKPTSDIAESKKQLWEPILRQMFTDALITLSKWEEDFEDIGDETANWNLRIQWPSVMQKEDPIYQQMLINRKNAGTLSIQSYLEAQGETKEELDRIREEMKDPITAAIHGNALGVLAEQVINPVDPNAQEKPRVSVSLRGDLTPAQEAELAQQQGFNSTGEMGPQGNQGLFAYEGADNQGFIDQNGKPITKTKGGQPQRQVATQANNTPGTQPMSMPGSGATATSPQGAINETNQQNGG